MYRNLICVFLLFSIVKCPAALALQVNNADSGKTSEEAGSLNLFLNSDFVKTSVWPGVGPFQSNSNNHLVDPSGNQVTYSAVNKQISSCQLEMRGGVSEAQCMLNLQMSVDFLLEGLGLKPGQIHTVNVEINKSSKLLNGNNYNPIHIDVSPFIVSLQNLGVTEGTDNSVYRVVVANQNLTSGNLEVSKSEETKNTNETVEKVEEDKTIEVAEVPSTNSPSMVSVQTPDKAIKSSSTSKAKSSESKNQQSADERQSDVVKETPASSRIGAQANNSDSSSNENNIDHHQNLDSEGSEKPAVASKPLSKDEQLKNDFRDVIQDWQTLKKTAVKERDTKLLSQALGGKALSRQTDAIKWLTSNHKYYDMTPGGAKVEKISALVANKKYAVFAEVKEKTKFVDDVTGRAAKETDDTYKVNYTIEKVGQKWLITDSALIKNTVEKSADKSGTQKDSTKKSVSEKSAKSTTKPTH